MFKKLSVRTTILIVICLIALAIGRQTVDPLADHAMTVCGVFCALSLISIVRDFQ